MKVLLNSVVATLASMPAMAHTGDHSIGLVQGFGHWFSSAEHMLALCVVAIGLAASYWAYRYLRSRSDAEKLPGTVNQAGQTF